MDIVNNCSLCGICGGCFFGGKSYAAQLAEKDARVRAALSDAIRAALADITRAAGGGPDSTADCDCAGGLDRQGRVAGSAAGEDPGPYANNIYEGIIPSPLVFGYRNKMEYSFGDSQKDGPLTLGLHRKRSFYDVIDVDECLLVHDDCNKIVKAAAGYFRELGLTYNDKKSHKGYLRHLIIRRAVNTGEMLIDLVTTSQRPVSVRRHADIYARNLVCADGSLNEAYGAKYRDEKWVLDGFMELMLGVSQSDGFSGCIKGILHTVNDSLSDAVRNDRTDILYGTDCITEELMGMKFDISPFSFFQTNSRGAEVLYGKVREFIRDGLDESMTVYDLYSGTGTIAQMLAPMVGHVTGVEIVKEAVEAARASADRNGLGNCDFIADDVLKALDCLPPPDVIVLDPPRDGINPRALKKLIGYGVGSIVYVSCKPESLQRDLVMLGAAGYRLIRAVAVDQFPWTNNVETVCLLSNRKYGWKSDTTINISLDMEDYYRIIDGKKSRSMMYENCRAAK